jgi:hypothetical protein
MQIIISYDSSVDNAPAGFKPAVEYAVNVLDAAFTNDVTINISVGWGETDGTPLTSDDLGTSWNASAPKYSYDTIKTALIANATSPLQQAADATLPASDPTGGDTFDIGSAEAKALGLIAGNAPATDGWVGFSSTANWSFSTTAPPGPNKFDIVGTIEHEITEVLGRVSTLGTLGEHYGHAFGVMDLFRFSSEGVRELAPGLVHSTGYFSIDDGVTSLGSWNNHIATGDLGDWSLGSGSGGGPGPGGSDSFNNLSNFGSFDQLSQSDLLLMNVIGWNPSEPANVVINGELYFTAAGQTSTGLQVLPGGILDISGTVNGAAFDGGKGEIFQDGTLNDALVTAGSTLAVDFGGAVNGVTIAGGFVDLETGASAGTAPILFQGAGGTLEIDSATAPGNVVSGFAAGDSIDFFGAAIGAAPTVTLLSGNVLEIVEHNKTYDLHFDPGDDFSGQTFHVSGDGSGGTLIYLVPSVTSVTTSGPGITVGNGDFDAGHVVTFTLHTNEPVNVDISNGTPALTLNDEGIATYTGGSGTDALTFTTTVTAGQNTPDLAVTGVNLNGATAVDANGHAADLTSAIGNPDGILQIDTTAPLPTGVTANPASGIETAGAAIALTLAFNEAVTVSGGTPALTLNDGEIAVYDAAATAALHDATRLAFDYLVSGNDTPTPALAVTGIDLHGAAINDLAGNPADFSTLHAAFTGLSVNDAPAFTVGGLTRPELHLDASGDIILDAQAAAAAAAYGTKFLYAGLPDTTPYPPVPDTSHSADFHLLT